MEAREFRCAFLCLLPNSTCSPKDGDVCVAGAMCLIGSFGQHFHWGKFPLGCSDDIRSGLDVQIKLKPQDGGKGDARVAPERFIEFP